VACPFFVPIEKLENGGWLHAHRLPLGCGWSGRCAAPEHEGEIPTSEELRDFCNLGYAEGCTRLPRERPWDSIRFSAKPVNGTGKDLRLHLRFVCERGHLPVEHGVLEFDVIESHWVVPQADIRVQRLAECFIATYVEKMESKKTAAPIAS
jgi:hypothetical protein